MKKRILALVSAVAVVICGSVVYALDASQPQILTEAIIAGEVCPTHLLQECPDCDGVGTKASYRTLCPICGEDMAIACDDYTYDYLVSSTCLVSAHPDDCINQQTHCWNYYVCDDCEYYQLGTRSDDYHLEAYAHTKCNHSTKCKNDAYCSLKRIDTYKAEWSSRAGIDGQSMTTSADAAEQVLENTINEAILSGNYEAVVAGDYCELHDTFGCDIYHD